MPRCSSVVSSFDGQTKSGFKGVLGTFQLVRMGADLHLSTNLAKTRYKM